MALDWNIYLKLYKYNIKKYLRKHEKHSTFTDCKWAIHSIIIVISIQMFSTHSDGIFHFSRAKKNYNSHGEFKRWIHWEVYLWSLIFIHFIGKSIMNASHAMPRTVSINFLDFEILCGILCWECRIHWWWVIDDKDFT